MCVYTTQKDALSWMHDCGPAEIACRCIRRRVNACENRSASTYPTSRVQYVTRGPQQKWILGYDDDPSLYLPGLCVV